MLSLFKLFTGRLKRASGNFVPRESWKIEALPPNMVLSIFDCNG